MNRRVHRVRSEPTFPQPPISGRRGGFLLRGDCLLLIAVAALLIARPASAQLLPFTHYTTESSIALPSADVNGVIQDNEGYVWFVIFSSGLARYNGQELQLYTQEDGLRSLLLRSAVQDRRGLLWVISDAGVVVSTAPISDYGPGERVAFTDTPFGLSLTSGTIERNAITADAGGGVWIGTQADGVIRYVIGSGGALADTIAVPSPDGVVPTVRALLTKRDGSVMASLSTGRVVTFDNQSAAFVETAARMDVAQPTQTLYEDRDGTLWGGTGGGELWRLNEDGSTTVIRDDLASVHNIFEDIDGFLWVANAGAGLLRMDKQSGRARLLTRRNGLLTETVHHVMQDHEHNLWFAQTGGVSKLRFDYQAFEQITGDSFAGETPILPAPSVGAVSVVPSHLNHVCTVFAGTDAGLVCLRPDGESQHIRSDDGLRNDRIFALAFDSDDRLWIGTSEGINAIDFGQRARLPPAGEQRTIVISGVAYPLFGYRRTTINGIAIAPIRSAANQAGAGESVWLPGYKSLYALVDGRWYNFRANAGLSAGQYNGAVVDERGVVWVGTRDEGLFRSKVPLTVADFASFDVEPIPVSLGDGRGVFGHEIMTPVFEQVWTVNEGAPSNQIDAIKLIDGNLWIGTVDGLVVLDPETLSVLGTVNRESGLPADNASSIAFASDSSAVWVGTNGGLAEVDPENLSVRSTATERDGLTDSEVWYYDSVDEDAGTVYYGSANGLTVFRPALRRVGDTSTPLHLERIAYRRTRSGHVDFEAAYSAAAYADEKAVQYRTMLQGYDDAWSEPTDEAKTRYTNLSSMFLPKDYTLRVAARAGDGDWTPVPLAHTFSVAPPALLSWWAFVSYLIIAGFGVVAANRVQRRRVLRKERGQTELREAKLRAEAADARTAAAQAEADVLLAENRRHAFELEKAKELEQAYHDLRVTQAQLVHAEKMASLGQLTAGIAHEIKNPLNFVNNFAELNSELADELEEMIRSAKSGNGSARDELLHLVSTVRDNSTQISTHGKRADAIVRAMMNHARGGGSERQGVDINEFVEQYASLAYHGMLARSEGRRVELVRDYGDDIASIPVSPQDLGRVFINLFDNAFYATLERAESEDRSFDPLVHVTTRPTASGGVDITISDNGFGIPEGVLPRIFEPFFTTKPTGEGTGLGLSMTYDIVVGGHNGSVTARNENGAVFQVTLPGNPEQASLPENNPAHTAPTTSPVAGS